VHCPSCPEWQTGDREGFPWADRLGQQVVSAALTLSQEPEGPFSCPLMTKAPYSATRLYPKRDFAAFPDRTTGRQLGTGTTGNGFRPGLGSYPTPGLFNPLELGTGSLLDLIAHLGDGIIVIRCSAAAAASLTFPSMSI